MSSGELLLAVENGVARSVSVTSLEAAGLMERQHLQEWIVAHPRILGPGVMVITVEYGGWVVAGGAQRDRLDVLGLDTDGRLVVAELKRGIAPDTVEMQAAKYAAMASRFTLDTLAAVHADFTTRRGQPLTSDQAAEALQTHAAGLTDETLANPRVLIIAQGFPPAVISSVVWLANRGVDISLVGFQPYRDPTGGVFVTFSQIFPLPDLEDSLVAPGAPVAEVSTEKLPVVEWSVTDLVSLGRIANPTTRTALDLCSDKPDQFVTLGEIVEAAGIRRPTARGQLAGLTMVTKRRFGRRNWPFAFQWAADGTEQVSYRMAAATAERWRQAAVQLDTEQSDNVDELAGADLAR